MNKKLTFVFLALVACLTVTGRERLNFNADWRLHIGDVPIGGDQEENWQRVTLPLRSYPLEVYAGKQLIWSGETERSLGYIHLKPSRQVKTDEITIRLKGAGKDKDAFGGITEVAQPAAGELDLFKAKNGDETNNELRIVEIELLESVD